MARYGERTRPSRAVSEFGRVPAAGIGVVQGYGVATGGTSSSITDGGQNYTLLTFTSDGNLVVSTAGLFDCLLVGGGSGGGGSSGNQGFSGGAGGGGVFKTTVYLDATTYAVTVGAGGAGNTIGGSSSIAVTSTLATVGGLVATYGGQSFTFDNLGRIQQANPKGINGACGAGQGSTTIPNHGVGAGVSGLGFGGGASSNTGSYTGGGGGGGGAGAVGNAGSGNTAGNGGAGKDISTFLGQSAGTTYKGGGGGGGASGSGAVNGSAGAGNGASNSGGGGRGMPNATAVDSNANGFSGIVYVRFKI